MRVLTDFAVYLLSVKHSAWCCEEFLISREFNKAYKCHVSIISLPLCPPVSVFHLNFYFSDPRDIIIHIFLSESQRDLQTEPSLMR